MNLKKDAFINTIGNFFYMGVLWLMSILTVRLGNFEIAGYFSLALTTSNIYISLASYTIRLFYAADVDIRFRDNQYFLLRLLTTCCSAILCLSGSFIIGYTNYQVVIIVLFYIYKCFEMMSDILYGCLQRHGKLYLCGYSLILKSLLSLMGFAATLFLFKNLIAALVVIVCIAALTFGIVDMGMVKYLKINIGKFNKEDFGKTLFLLRICFPFFWVGLCYNLLPSIPRLAFERLYTAEQFGIYSSISTVTVLISTAVSCITVVIIPRLAELYHQKKTQQFLKVNIICIAAVIMGGIITLLLADIYGEWFLTLLFGAEITPFVSVFRLIIIASILTSIVICFNNFFAAVNQQQRLLPGCVSATFICIITAIPLCERFYMNGVALSLILSQGLEILVLLIAVIKIIRKMNAQRG